MKKCGTNRVRTLAFVAGLTFYGTALADIEFDQDVTPDVIFGSGNLNGAFTTDRNDGVEIGLRGKLRFDGAGQPQNIFNSNGDGTYTFQAIVAPTKLSQHQNGASNGRSTQIMTNPRVTSSMN